MVFKKIKDGLAKTRRNLLDRVDESPEIILDSEKFYEELEDALILADAGVATTSFLMGELVKRVGSAKGKEKKAVKLSLQEIIENLLLEVEESLDVSPPFPFVILVVGVNGSGKTTTIGKIARQYIDKGYSIVLGAGDTFRAAAIEQLELWGERVGVKVVKHRPGADASAVAFDTVRNALSRNIDLAIIDTAGRLHTNRNLMAELGKVKRVIQKELPHGPSEIMLVIDATTGQNGILQAKSFTESLGVTGIAVSKIDGTAKGGVLLSITRELGIPVRYVGVGEREDDLRPFKAHEFARAMLFDE